MRILIAEDEQVSAVLLQRIMGAWGSVDLAENGQQAFAMYEKAYRERKMYDVICLDILMPHLSGQQTLDKIRQFERSNGIGGKDMVPVIMTTILSDQKNILQAFLKGVCEGYLIKPITAEAMRKELLRLDLIS